MGDDRRQRAERKGGDDVGATPADLSAEAAVPTHALAVALGRDPAADEVALWTPMSPAHRRRALERMALLTRWTADRGDLDAESAAKLADVGIKRFYQLASAWKKEPSLTALGAFAGVTFKRASKIDARANQALQANLARVVAAHPKASVEEQRRLLKRAARDWLDQRLGAVSKKIKLPSRNTLRDMIEGERRRVAQKGLVASQVLLDFSATSLARPDGRPHVLFAACDSASGMILGWSLGEPSDAMAGYGAAMTSLLTGDAYLGLGVPWASRVGRIDAVPDEDVAGWIALSVAFAGRKDVPVLQPASAEPPGRYLRRFVGEQVGRLYLHFARTLRDDVDARTTTPNRYSDAEARVRVADEVRGHNGVRAGEVKERGKSEPPPDLLAAADLLAGWARCRPDRPKPD